MQTFKIGNSLTRVVKVYFKQDPAVPEALFRENHKVVDISGIRYPLPSKKSAYTCFAEAGNALWMGADNGLTRYEPNAAHETDKVMYFSAIRDLNDNKVLNIIPGEDLTEENVWVLTESAVSHITLKAMSPEEKAEVLTEETLQYVSRRGMVTQRELTVPREHSSRVPFGHSDNDGTFTVGFAIGELCKYAVMKKKYGENHPKTTEARKTAVRATEACQLLMYIAGRGDGFVARTYLVASEPVPDDGLFYRKENGKAVCLQTTDAKKRGIAGKVIDASAPVPERLARLYKDEGYSENGIVYKGDTSSDEITNQFLLIYFAHEILGEEDPELDTLLKDSAVNTLNHILDNGYQLHECDGKPTTWAKWDLDYFSTPLGWSDGCLNAAELLMYHKVVMHITGEKGKWEESYRHLIDDLGYAKLSTLHDARFHVSAGVSGNEPVEELMYGDNMLATCAYWMLITLEEDDKLRAMYKEGYKGWDLTFRREHNPAYDFPYMLSNPEETLDTERLSDWFRRQGASRLAAGITMTGRHDVPIRTRFGGELETGWLLPPDENMITKYDRNPYALCDDYRTRGLYIIESCYVYTFAYWLGRYYGFIEEE